MKLTASGVANCAAIVRSPSFSRSAASTTTTNLPWRMSSIASSIVAKGARFSSSVAIRLIVSGLPEQRLEDQFGNLDANRPFPGLGGEDADRVVEPRVALVARRVEDSADDLASVVARPAVAAEVERDARAVLGLDHALEVRQVDVVLGAQPRVVHAPEAPGEVALAAALGEVD